MQVQWEAVETILQAVKQCPEIKAAFLKGSLAKGIADEYSDVDFYCLVDTARLEQFLKKRLEILESYRPVIYHSESDFVGPQLVAVFDNGLHFDLYTVTLEAFPRMGKFRVLYDPHGLLEQFETEVTDYSMSGRGCQVFSRFQFHTAGVLRRVEPGGSDMVGKARKPSGGGFGRGIALRLRSC